MKTGPLPTAWLEVLAERENMLAQGVRSPEGDDRLSRGELAIASALYLLMGTDATVVEPYGVRGKIKTLGRRANLVRGIALGLAELERFDRAKGPGEPEPRPPEMGQGDRPEAPGGLPAPVPDPGMGRASHPACVERCSSPVCFNCR